MANKTHWPTPHLWCHRNWTKGNPNLCSVLCRADLTLPSTGPAHGTQCSGHEWAQHLQESESLGFPWEQPNSQLNPLLTTLCNFVSRKLRLQRAGPGRRNSRAINSQPTVHSTPVSAGFWHVVCSAGLFHLGNLDLNWDRNLKDKSLHYQHACALPFHLVHDCILKGKSHTHPTMQPNCRGLN